MDTEESPGGGPGTGRNKESNKRRRLNFACNYCRTRKTRCDEQQPSCHACIVAGIPCVTEDRRRPGKLIKRREAGKTTDGVSLGSASPSEHGLPSANEDILTRRISISRETRTASVAVGPRARSQSPRQSQSRDSSNTETISNPLPLWRQSTGTTSFQILTEWLDLSCFRLNVPYHFGACPPSHRGLGSADLGLNSGSMRSWFHNPMPVLLEGWSVHTLIDAYEREVHIFYPVLRISEARAETSHTRSPLQAFDVTELKTCLLLAAGGCILQHNEWNTYMRETLSLARTALGHLIGSVSIEAMEILFLFSVCLRLNDEITSSWTTLGICLSVAHSLELNKPGKSKTKNANPPESDIWSPAWWALYSYEKLLSFQLGYVSSISDETYDALDLEILRSANLKPHQAVLSMARVFSKISHRCVKAGHFEDRASRRTVETAIKEKVNATGESFLMLTNWINSLPADIRPTSDFMRVPEDLSLSSFISLHYHNAKDSLYKAVEIIAKDTPWEHSTRNGQSMVANSARKIIHLLADRDDSAPPHLFAPAYFPLLHAIYVLAVHILKQPNSRISKIDQSLLLTAADLVRCYCVGFDESDRLNNVLNGLVRVVQDAMKPAATSQDNQQPPPATNAIATEPALDTTPLPRQRNDSSFAQAMGTSDSSLLNPELPLDEGILDPFLGQPFAVPILPDEIGCDWADFENLLQRIESDGALYSTDEGMDMNI
ncbi:hypothetical protein FSARC_654 [Fusarium sarcochroum]|uniref:Zn(2)-C6 fungal-type domain-containing protein n=1 Tax=Fusarium sarcochroum TaxID=1208366 RepID=A0A8H4UAJ2_9HYPO|nr:hypothetical protein FSARC_654 [Fusarium sarcochroum]